MPFHGSFWVALAKPVGSLLPAPGMLSKETNTGLVCKVILHFNLIIKRCHFYWLKSMKKTWRKEQQTHRKKGWSSRRLSVAAAFPRLERECPLLTWCPRPHKNNLAPLVCSYYSSILPNCYSQVRSLLIHWAHLEKSFLHCSGGLLERLASAGVLNPFPRCRAVAAFPAHDAFAGKLSPQMLLFS